MSMQHLGAVTQTLHIEIGYASELGLASLTDAIIEALENGGVVEEAGIVYMKATSPHERLSAVNLWAPEAEKESDIEPPTIPAPFEKANDSQPEPN